MKISNLLKLFPVLALMFMMNVPNALAGGTNRGDNTDATPGEKATTTKEVIDPSHDRRKGTNNRDMNNRTGNDKNRTQDMNDTTGTDATGSGTGTGGTGTDTGTSGTGTGGTGTDSTGTSSGGY